MPLYFTLLVVFGWIVLPHSMLSSAELAYCSDRCLADVLVRVLRQKAGQQRVIAPANGALSDEWRGDLRLSGRTPAGSLILRTAGRQHCGARENLVCLSTSQPANFTSFVYPTLRAISPSASQASSFSSMYAFSTLNLHKRATRSHSWSDWKI